MIKKSKEYYALVYNLSRGKFFIVKSEDYRLIQLKIKSLIEFPFPNSSSCDFIEKEKVDRNQRYYNWSFGGHINIDNESYEIYFHKKTKGKLLPPIELDIGFLSNNPIREAVSITKIDPVKFSFKDLNKKCQVRLIHIAKELKL